MNKIAAIIGISCSLLFMTGCETTTTRPYAASTENVLKFQSVLKSSGQKVALGSFSENSEIGTLNCRLNGPVDVSSGKSRAEYIKNAMQTELFMAEVYAVDAGTTITGSLDSLTFSSVSPASWEIEFSVASNKSDGFSLTTKYPFKTSYSAYNACKNVADSFGPAVQQLIRDIINHNEFPALVGQ